MSVSEKRLVEQALEGDQHATATLFEQYRPRLRRMVELRMDARLRARVDASDVLQEAFVDVSRQLDSYREKRSEIPFFLWLRLQTGSRLAQLHRRHLGTEKRDVNREQPPMHIPDASSIFMAGQLAGQFTSVDRGLRKQEVADKLLQTLNSLSDKDREIIAMRHYEELSTEEIAISLGMTRSGVLKRYGRAIERLTEVVGDQQSQFDI
ncbi:MAG: sigma-70 family RNA polymerase sigma factor [Planctomycetota bacterium]